MDKEIFIRAHEELVAEYLERHPNLSWDAAYDRTAPFVTERVTDYYATMIDEARMMAKEGE